jgi:hypothetical protein
MGQLIENKRSRPVLIATFQGCFQRLPKGIRRREEKFSAVERQTLALKHAPGAPIAASKDYAILNKITAVRPFKTRAASRSERPCAES